VCGRLKKLNVRPIKETTVDSITYLTQYSLEEKVINQTSVNGVL
jgi:hypothetical protein